MEDLAGEGRMGSLTQSRVDSVGRMPDRNVGRVTKVVLVSLTMLLAAVVFALPGESGRVMVDLGAWAGVFDTSATLINDRGQVAGNADGGGGSLGFYWDADNGFVRVEPTSDYMTLNDMNGLGQVAGDHFLGHHQWHAFTWDVANGYEDLSPMGDVSGARSINDNGYVAGWNWAYDGTTLGALLPWQLTQVQRMRWPWTRSGIRISSMLTT
jgi:uncharacterized membrane protein